MKRPPAIFLLLLTALFFGCEGYVHKTYSYDSNDTLVEIMVVPDRDSNQLMLDVDGAITGYDNLYLEFPSGEILTPKPSVDSIFYHDHIDTTLLTLTHIYYDFDTEKADSLFTRNSTAKIVFTRKKKTLLELTLDRHSSKSSGGAIPFH